MYICTMVNEIFIKFDKSSPVKLVTYNALKHYYKKMIS